ncbi:OmpW family protein [compost metagenome]
MGICCLFTAQVMAQRYYTNFSWNTSLPMGTTKDFTDKFSVRGVSFEWGGFIKPQVSAGVSVGWNVFYEQKGRSTYTFDNGLAVTGSPYNYINAIPIIFKGHYHFKDPATNKTAPYFGVGVGTTWQKRNTDFGLNSYYSDGWMFGLFPEVGLNYQINPYSGINFNVRYNYNFETGDVSELSFFGFNIGYVYKY